jgi:hypothetical protein
VNGGDVLAVGSLSSGQSEGSFGCALVGLSGLDGSVGPVKGSKLLVEDEAGDPSRRRMRLLARDQTIVTAPTGSAGDPTAGGATLQLVNPVTLESATLSLPGGSSWRTRIAASGSPVYRYSDPRGDNGPCKMLSLRTGRLKADCNGHLGTIPFSLDEASQGALTVSLQTGTAAPQCATFGGTIQHDAGTSNPGPAGSFRARNAPVAQGDCP